KPSARYYDYQGIAELFRGACRRRKETMTKAFDQVKALVISSAMGLAMGGCAHSEPTTRPASMRERQDEALRDPFGYKMPEMETVTGDKSSDFDRAGFKRDVKSVFNP